MTDQPSLGSQAPPLCLLFQNSASLEASTTGSLPLQASLQDVLTFRGVPLPIDSLSQPTSTHRNHVNSTLQLSRLYRSMLLAHWHIACVCNKHCPLHERRPDRGSIRWGNSTSTSVIAAMPPQPMYTTTLESAHLAIWCNVTVLPVPKPPGIAPVPPFAIGK